jgi:hypothetical protein
MSSGNTVSMARAAKPGQHQDANAQRDGGDEASHSHGDRATSVRPIRHTSKLTPRYGTVTKRELSGQEPWVFWCRPPSDTSPRAMAAPARHATPRPDARLPRYTDGHPVTYRRYDGL